MKRNESLINIIITLVILMLTSSCRVADYIENRARIVNRYEERSLILAKENRELKSEISRLHYKLKSVESKNFYLEGQLSSLQEKNQKVVMPKRKIASVAPIKREEDMVGFDVYKWSPSQVLAIAEKEFGSANYIKAAQFFHTFVTKYPEHKKLDDKVLFQAGVAAFESGKYHKWTMSHLGNLVKNYPTSPFYRGAKLWMALTNLKQGKTDDFFATVEEFRKKYRNTSEWKILSKHYEKIVQKHKRQL